MFRIDLQGATMPPGTLWIITHRDQKNNTGSIHVAGWTVGGSIDPRKYAARYYVLPSDGDHTEAKAGVVFKVLTADDKRRHDWADVEILDTSHLPKPVQCACQGLCGHQPKKCPSMATTAIVMPVGTVPVCHDCYARIKTYTMYPVEQVNLSKPGEKPTPVPEVALPEDTRGCHECDREHVALCPDGYCKRCCECGFFADTDDDDRDED